MELKMREPKRDGSSIGISENDLEEALKAARDGDEMAFATIWRHHNPRLTRFVQAKTYAGAIDYEEVISDTWMSVARDIRKFKGDFREFTAWLYQISRNRIVDAARKRDRTIRTTEETEEVFWLPDVQSIEKALRFQISTGASEGDRSFTFTHIDHAGNRSDGATVTFTVDTLAPSATLTTNANGIAAKSTEVGTAYLVKDSLAVTQLNDILVAADDLWNATSINAVNIDTSLDTGNLSNGSYVLYTSDRAGNLSASTSNHVVL